MKPKTIIILIIIALSLIIIIQNTREITLQLFFWETNISFILFILLMMVIGFVLGFYVRTKTKIKKE